MDRLSFLLDLCPELRKGEVNRCFYSERITSEMRILIGSILQKPVPEKGKPEQILLESVKGATYALLQRIEESPLCAMCAINQNVISVWCEYIRDARIRISTIWDDCFHELVEKLFFVRVSDTLSWKCLVLNIYQRL